MNNITCPCCGGQKATQINDREYRCEYCGNTFIHTTSNSKPTPTPQPTPQQFVAPPVTQQIQQPQPSMAYNNQYVSDKSRTVAAILAIVLGGLGVHHFYLGNIGKGILYLLLCWTYIPAIVGFIEGIIYLTQSDAEFAIKHPRK